MPPASAKAYDNKTQNPLPQKDIIKPWAGSKTKRGADETAQWVREPAATPDDLILITGVCMMSDGS